MMESSMMVSLFDHMDDWVAYQDLQGIYRYCNLAFAEMVGCDRSKIIGQKNSSLFLNVRQALENTGERPTETVSFEQEIVNGAQLSRWFNIRTTPVCDDKNTLQGILVLGHDITVEKQMEANLWQHFAPDEEIYDAATEAVEISVLPADSTAEDLDTEPSDFQLLNFSSPSETTAEATIEDDDDWLNWEAS